MRYPFPFLTLIALALTTSFEANAQQLPANPDPNKCYVRVVSLPEYETVWDSVLTYTEEDALIYPHRERFKETKPERTWWESVRLPGCDSDDCQVLCKKAEPSEGFTYYKPKDKKKGTPYWQPYEATVVYTEGGLASYEEIDCALTSYNVLHINYRSGSAALDADERLNIDDRLLNLMLDRPKIRIQINAHTASPGSAASNLELTELRAIGIANYLVSKGIDRERLVTRGYGESQLKNRCADGVRCSEAEHAVNRRVEFRVLNVDW